MNNYALRTIQEADAERKSWSVLSFLLPWRTVPPATNAVVIATFTNAMDVQAEEMERLIIEAEISLNNLNMLEEGLSTVNGIVGRENVSLSDAKAELLADLWTILGGNRRKLRGFDQHLYMLKHTEGYRQQALAHVVATLEALKAMTADMEDMRERVAAPELTAGRIPIEVHMKSIQSGLERLTEGRLRARVREQEALQRVLEGLESRVSVRGGLD